MAEINLEQFLKNADENQKELLFHLGEAAKKEDELCKKINRVFNSIKSGVYSPDGFEIIVCKDQDDALIISAKDREELDNVRRTMKGYMIEAVKLGMKDLGIIQRNYQNYVGEELK